MLLSVVANRVAMALLTLAGVAVVVFVLLRVVPGDPVAMMISPGAGPADIAALKAHYGLDAPLLVQFWIWIKGVVTGDFGTSITLHVCRDRGAGVAAAGDTRACDPGAHCRGRFRRRRCRRRHPDAAHASAKPSSTA